MGDKVRVTLKPPVRRHPKMNDFDWCIWSLLSAYRMFFQKNGWWIENMRPYPGVRYTDGWRQMVKLYWACKKLAISPSLYLTAQIELWGNCETPMWIRCFVSDRGSLTPNGLERWEAYKVEFLNTRKAFEINVDTDTEKALKDGEWVISTFLKARPDIPMFEAFIRLVSDLDPRYIACFDEFVERWLPRLDSVMGFEKVRVYVNVLREEPAAHRSLLDARRKVLGF
jgi:hypothetical protein